jgi:hypothetical protein
MILYWFRPPKSKTLRPVLRFVLLRSQVVVEVDVTGRCPWGTPLPALYWATDKVGGPESGSVTTRKPISSLFTSWTAYPSCLNPFGLTCLAHQAVFSSGESSGRSSGARVGGQLGQLGPLTGRRVFW